MPRTPRRRRQNQEMNPLDALTELANLPPEALEQIFQEEMESSHEPMAIPLLPIRDQVYYPHMVFSLLVGRERSVRAVESASNAQRFLFLAAQSNLEAEDPAEEDLYRVGIVAEIMQIMRLPDGNVRLMLEGVARYQIMSVIQQEPYFEVLVDPQHSYLPPANDIEALIRVVKGQFEQIINTSQSLPPEILAQVMQIDEPGHLADNIAAALKSLKIDRQQKVLECLDIRERLLLLGRLLTEESRMLELQQGIRQRIEREMGDSQREYMLREQIRLLQNELGDRGDLNEFEELRQQVTNAKMPEKVNERCLKEIDRLEKMPFAAPEGVVVRNYLDWMLALPWSAHTPDNVDLTEALRILDSDHYGLEKIKERIIEFLAVRKLTGTIRGPILCFVGPPGVGKTSIGQSIAQALGRKFVRVSLGGVRDEAEIRGHRRTYIGAMPGRILQGMKQAGTRNPVFMLDEIDKLGMDFRGDPSSALLEALDPEQNSEFSDHYLEAPYDLSDVMFIATSNLLENIPHALRDRMEVLQFTGYTEMEKLAIAEQFLLAKQKTDHGLKPNQITITSDALRTLIREYTREAGVRNLEREIANLCRKVTRKVVAGEAKRVKIDAKQIPDYLGQRKYLYGVMEEEDQIGIATGLVYTEVGGDIVTIEVSLLKGHEGRVQLTGSLGDVMKESAQTAFSFVRSCAKQWELDEEFYRKLDVHVHVPAGAVPKDGPSAGITIATALASALTQSAVRRDIAMTGEITLRGRVLPVGGVKEKVLAAHRAGIRKVLLPKENHRDLDDLPEYVRGEMKFHFVDHVEQVFLLALVPKK